MNTTDTYAYAIRTLDGTLLGSWDKHGPELWADRLPAEDLVSLYPTLAGCTVVKVRITTDLGETQ